MLYAKFDEVLFGMLDAEIVVMVCALATDEVSAELLLKAHRKTTYKRINAARIHNIVQRSICLARENPYIKIFFIYS